MNTLTQNPLTQNPILLAKVGCKGCTLRNSHTNPVANYQNQQRIWNTVRINCAQYIMNKGALSAVDSDVQWNQQSDRRLPHVQIVTVPSRGNSTKRTITRARPGASTPGGIGCDIKFNSYDRYLNKLKGKSILKRGYISPEITKIIANTGQIPFNPAFPIYGGKYYKTNIVATCKCPSPLVYSKPVFTNYETLDLRVFNVGQLISWELCKYAKITNFLTNSLIAIRYLDIYGDEKGDDIVDLTKINAKRIDPSVFKKKEKFRDAKDYFEEILEPMNFLKIENLENSLDNICFE